MPRKVPELSAIDVREIRKPGMHTVGGVAGLYLQVTGNAKSWVLRITVGGRRREMGLGGYPDVPLSQAREKAREARQVIERGQDPIELREEARRRLIASRASRKTFKECANLYLAAHSDGWKHVKTHQQWLSSFESYVFPKLGELLVSDIDQTHVLEVLEPIWKTKTETATRVRNRIESVLAFATVRGYRHGENPAQWKNRLDKLLPSPARVRKAKHFAALPYDQMSGFMTALRARDGYAARALEFLVLTAARSGEVRGATWPEIDGSVWTIPASRMKAGKEHRIPLSAQAISMLKGLKKVDGCDYIFAGAKGGALSDMALLKVVRDMKADCVPHGFRSTLRDWAGDCTNFPREIAEHALAHTVGDKVEAAYRRSDAFDKRKKMMQAWADYCEQRSDGKILQMRKKSLTHSSK